MGIADQPAGQMGDQSPEPRVIPDATCTACGCLCDDMVLTVVGDRITEAQNACGLGRAWFLDQRIDDRPAATINGQPASYEQAISRAVERLLAAKSPLVYGLSATTSETQKVAVAIADAIGGTLDTTTLLEDGQSGVAFQGVGEITATFGEIKNRADFLLYWDVDPVETHPRHFSRYSLTPRGEFLPNGRADRTAVLLAAEKSKTADAMDQFIPIKPGADFELAWAMRALLRGVQIDGEIERQTGVARETLIDLVERMKQARYGVILFGDGLTKQRGTYINAEAVLLLVRDLNEYTRFVAAPLRGAGNGVGADNVVAWQTGYPFAVSLSRGYPRYNPGEFSAGSLLENGEVDLALVVAADPLPMLGQQASSHLAGIPLITIGPTETATSRQAEVALTTSTYGINTGGTVYRADGVPIPLRPALPSPYRSDLELLTAIETELRRRTGNGE